MIEPGADSLTDRESPKESRVEAKQKPTYYQGVIAAYEREFKKWEGRVEKVIKRYRDSDSRNTAKFNVLWSNVQTLKAATFARTPQPDVSRRFKDNDQVGRVAALLLERALEFEIQHHGDFAVTIRQCIYDRFLGGRGSAWVRYHPTFKAMEQDDGPLITEDVDSESPAAEELDNECAPVDYVHWRDFGHAVARTWEEVPIVWRKVYMRRNALVERFGEEVGGKVPLDSMPNSQQGRMKAEDLAQQFALIYEIWDKDTGQALWWSKSLNQFVDVKDDPLGLEEFFPCPRPLYATLTNEDLQPLPDFTLYQDQAKQLDLLADRISGLCEQLQLRGVHDASVPALSRLLTEAGNGELIPVDNWMAFAEKSGLKGSIEVLDILPVAQALREAYTAFDQLKGQIYELTGISDILRGQTAPSETATAQQIKNNYASLRLKVYQDEVERFATKLLQLKAQVICAHFDPQIICRNAACDQMTPEDQQLVPAALQLLKNAPMRSFRIEIQTDSMAYQDEQQEKQDRMEFLNATSMFMEKAVQAATASPQLVPIAVELLKFGVTGFRVGKSMEGTIDKAMDQIQAQAQQPPPNPEAVKAQAAQQQTQMQIQADQQKQQLELQTRQQIEQMKMQHDQQLSAMQQQHDAAVEQMKAQYADAQAQRELDFQRWKTAFDNEVKVIVAEIAAKTSVAQTALSAPGETDSEGNSKPNDAVTQVVDLVAEKLPGML